jgi:hypothetical protein
MAAFMSSMSRAVRDMAALRESTAMAGRFFILDFTRERKK